MISTRLHMAVLAAGFLSAIVMAQPKPKEEAKALPKGFRGEFLAQLNDVESKLVDLATAVPQEKYGWRPAEGVRSVSEVYMHVAGGNYFVLSFIGVKRPDGVPRDLEKTVTEKAKVVDNLRQSFDFVRTSVMNVPDKDLDKPASFFGNPTTVRGVLLNLGLHMHEHLGQSIAYARMNGVVPPWTAAQNREEKGKKK